MPPATITAAWLADFVQETLLLGSGPIDARTPLISSGLLDSYSVVELIVHVESYCEVTIPPSMRTLENFETVERIITMLARLGADLR